MVTTLTWLVASASLIPMAAAATRYGNAPKPAVQGTAVPFAGAATAAAHAVTALRDAVARKADDRARPRGRRR